MLRETFMQFPLNKNPEEESPGLKYSHEKQNLYAE
jgi:hypothetical protein